ncbi:MAG: 30S ribosomal protein S5 [Candidatus Thermoplasmatota archaeon]
MATAAAPVLWTPKTLLGKLVAEGKITTLTQALSSGLPLKEPEIVDALIAELKDEILDINMVQRMTDSGRRIKFAVTVAVGNHNGFIGLGRVKGTEVAATIKKAIDSAKLNVIEIKRGCGSWECGCMQPHSLPFKVTGKCGSAEITLLPAPRGVGLACADAPKTILKLAGIKDVWTFTRGETRTSVNFAKATYNALLKVASVKITSSQEEKLKIKTGPVSEALLVEEKGGEVSEASTQESAGSDKS